MSNRACEGLPEEVDGRLEESPYGLRPPTSTDGGRHDFYPEQDDVTLRAIESTFGGIVDKMTIESGWYHQVLTQTCATWNACWLAVKDVQSLA
jgi:hypothetical protein